MSESEQETVPGKAVHTIGPNGQLRLVEYKEPETEVTSAKAAADKLHVKYNEHGDNGDMTTRDAGRIGGQIGGPMVRKMVYLAKQELAKQHVDDLIEAQQNKRP